MPWIKGIGDEVILFFVSISVLFIGLIAWLSTSIGDLPVIRAVLILEQRPRNTNSIELHAETNSEVPDEDETRMEAFTAGVVEEVEVNGQEPGAINEAGVVEEVKVNGQEPGASNEAGVVEEEVEVKGQGPGAINEAGVNSQPNINNGNRDRHVQVLTGCNQPNCSACCPGTEIPEVNSSCDSETGDISCVLRQRRSFFEDRQATLLPVVLPQAETEQTVAAESVPDPASNRIRIRLKFLNDEQKLVEGCLREQLASFKRRNFSSEIRARKLIRLIFNGHVLQRDEETLGSYGLFDNCVIHCVVHQLHNTNDLQTVAENAVPNDRVANRDWQLGSTLFLALTLLLGAAWVCRYLFSQLFNATSTVALVGLTGILTVSLVGTLYLPNEDAVR